MNTIQINYNYDMMSFLLVELLDMILSVCFCLAFGWFFSNILAFIKRKITKNKDLNL